jgi:GNAT superfamily N-acetyltransferase
LPTLPFGERQPTFVIPYNFVGNNYNMTAPMDFCGFSDTLDRMGNDGDPKHTDKVAMRIADSGDSALVLQFIRELAEYEHRLDEVKITEDMIRQWISADRIEVLIAEYEGKPAGFALYYFTYPTFCGQTGMYLEDLFVRPQFRHQGIGTLFFHKLAEVARVHNCIHIDWMALVWNVNSINFYEKLGAKAVTEWNTYRLPGAAMDKLARR